MAQEPTAAQKLLGEFAPELVRLTDEVLFGQVWAGEGLYAGWPNAMSAITQLKDIVESAEAG
jgi:alkylhydroperoxidase/carboxymuconolactone decarboxylase family protein YurZ